MENKQVLGQMTKEEAKRLTETFNRNALLLEIESKVREFHKFNNGKLELNDVLYILSDFVAVEK